MAYDYSKLLGKITERVGTQAMFAERMNLSERTISLKLNGRIGFKQDEIIKACNILDISPEMISDYFFKAKVQ